MSDLAWVNQYVGIPFADDGVTRAGCNCWGLVRLVLKERKGIDLPAFEATPATDLIGAAREFRKNIAGEPWTPIERDARKPFDCVLMTAMTDDTVHRLPAHVGIMINRNFVLHVWAATHAVTMPIGHRRLHNKILGFYRHKDLAA